MKKIAASLTLSTLITFSSAFASDMKPGLWANTFSFKSKSGNLEKTFAAMSQVTKSMTPEERKIYAESQAEQGAAIFANGSTSNNCVSKATTDKLEIPKGAFGNCSHKEVSRTPNSVKVKFDCKAYGNGEGEFKVVSPTSYKHSGVMNLVIGGVPDVINYTETGKWLSADCGKIK